MSDTTGQNKRSLPPHEPLSCKRQCPSPPNTQESIPDQPITVQVKNEELDGSPPPPPKYHFFGLAPTDSSGSEDEGDEDVKSEPEDLLPPVSQLQITLPESLEPPEEAAILSKVEELLDIMARYREREVKEVRSEVKVLKRDINKHKISCHMLQREAEAANDRRKSTIVDLNSERKWILLLEGKLKQHKIALPRHPNCP